MPTISLRLTEEEHAALKEWAHGSRRSMQREAVFRIFSELSERDHYASLPGDGYKRPELKNEGAAKSMVAQDPAARSESPDDHFKPDFKKGKS